MYWLKVFFCKGGNFTVNGGKFLCHYSKNVSLNA